MGRQAWHVCRIDRRCLCYSERVLPLLWRTYSIALLQATVELSFVREFLSFEKDAAFFGAIVFLLIQVVLLIDFAASWSESWVGHFEETGEKKWFVLLVAALSLCLIASLVLTILLYGART